jgi:ABC-type antimicrobial peptide transport system permease subunit
MASVVGAFKSVSRRAFRTILISFILALSVAVLISTIAGVQSSEESTKQIVDEAQASTAALIADVEASTAALTADIETRTVEMVANIEAATQEMVAGVIAGAEITIGLAEQLDVMITVNPGRPGITETDVSNIQAIEGVAAVIPRFFRHVGLEPGTRNYDYSVFGVLVDASLVDEYPILPPAIIDGRQLEEGDTAAILLSVGLLEYFENPEVGDTIEVNFNQVEIIGIFYSTNTAEQKRIYMSLEGAQSVFAAGDEVSSLRVYAELKSEVESMAAEIENLQSGWRVRTPDDRQSTGVAGSITQTQEEQIERIQDLADQQMATLLQNAEVQIESMLSSAKLQTVSMQSDADIQIAALQDDLVNVESLGSLIIRVVAIAGVLIIFGIMFYTVRERRKEIGILKALGFSNLSVMKRFMLEGFYIGLLGGLIGIALGVVTYSMVGPWLLDINEAISVSLEPYYLLIGLGAAVLFGTLGSLYPAWQASRVSPMEALRSK